MCRPGTLSLNSLHIIKLNKVKNIANKHIYKKRQSYSKIFTSSDINNIFGTWKYKKSKTKKYIEHYDK